MGWQRAADTLHDAPGALFAQSPSRPSVTATRQIEILELEDLERECLLARIRLTLVQHDLSAAAVAGKRDAARPPLASPGPLARSGAFRRRLGEEAAIF